MKSAVVECSGRAGTYDPLAPDAGPALDASPAEPDTRPAPPVVQILSLGEIISYEPPTGSLLVGDGVLELGENSLLYVPAGASRISPSVRSRDRAQAPWWRRSIEP